MIAVRTTVLKTCLSGLLALLIWLPAMPSQAEMSQDLPAPLSDFDVAQYQRLFHLQEVGRMKQATREMFRLENDILRGHLLSQRYLHPTAWRSPYKQLSSWLKVYNDHPDASRIFWLAKKRRPKNAAAPKSPKPGYLNGYGLSSGSSYRPRIPMYTGGPRRARHGGWPVKYGVRSGVAGQVARLRWSTMNATGAT